MCLQNLASFKFHTHLLLDVAQHIAGEVLDKLVVELLVGIPGAARDFFRRGCWFMRVSSMSS